MKSWRRWLATGTVAVSCALGWRWWPGTPTHAETAPVVVPSAVAHPVSKRIHLQARIAGVDEVAVSWSAPAAVSTKGAVLYRSTGDLSIRKLDIVHYPIVLLPIDASQGKVEDDTVPDDATCYYQLKLGDEYSDIVAVTLPDRPLPTLTTPSLWVDKIHYVLEVRDGQQTIKRYPMALGRNPFDRKLHQDNATTPEGFYQVCGVNRDSDFHHAYDVSYPNDIDKFRYDFAARHHQLPPNADGTIPDIGSEIQIHGGGIVRNWTYGCMALRNTDMDELFAHTEIANGTPIIIVGHEIAPQDVATLQGSIGESQWQTIESRLPDLSPSHLDPTIVGQYQADHLLPVTGQLDTRTLASLGAAPP